VSTGSLANGVCFETAALAVDAHFAGLPPFSYPSGTQVFTVSYSNLNGVWSQDVWGSMSGSANTWLNSTTLAPVPSFPVCYAPSEQYNDGLSIGFALVSLMILPWLMAQLKKGLF
jgi:hypothetical protein